MARRAAWAALLVQPAFLAYWLIASALEPGYSPARQHVSELGAPRAAAPWLLDAMLVLWGASMILAAVAVRRAWAGRARLAVALLALAGVCLALAGPFHLTCWPSVARGCARGDFSAAAHGILAGTGQIALLLSVPALAWALRGERAGRRLLLPAGIALLVLLGFATGPHGDRSRRGAEQRVGIAAAQAWIAGIAAAALVRLRT